MTVGDIAPHPALFGAETATPASSRRAKIVCTLGPATASDEGIAALVAAGMDVARLNFSHGDHADHRANYQRVRTASDASGRAVGVLADLQGPKIRLGRFADGSTTWETGEQISITVEDCRGSHDRVSTTYENLARRATRRPSTRRRRPVIAGGHSHRGS
jgi:pyruvate kinase